MARPGSSFDATVAVRHAVCRSAIAAALIFGLTVPASATLLTQTVTFGPGLTDYSGATGSPQTISYFDTNAGTLNSITFSSTYGFNSSISVTNTSSSSSTGNVFTQSAAQFSSNTSAVTQALNSYVNNYVDPIDKTSVTFGSSTLTPIAYDVRGSNASYTLGAGGTTNLTSTESGNRSSTAIVTASDLATFSRTGGGSFTPTFTTLSGLVLSNTGGNVTATQTTKATGSLTIQYDYTAAAVPETETWAMMLAGFGVVGAGLRAGRRRVASPPA